MTELLPLLMQGGAVAVFLMVSIAVVRGDLRTRQEVEGLARSLERSNAQVDKMLPSLQELTVTVNRQNELIQNLLNEIDAPSPKGAA